MSSLYHYCSNEKCFSILRGKTIRLSDIQKSNDYMEMSLFFPEIIDIIEEQYLKAPFPLKYKNLHDQDALLEMTNISYDYWKKRFDNGDFSNFVVCFSEKADTLSQWRGYADNGKGCCIGFSKQLLLEYCKMNKSILTMQKVEYLTEEQIHNRILYKAKECLDSIKLLREWIVDNMTHDDNSPDTDNLLHFNFDGILSSVFNGSLGMKSKAFSEEKEWRIFFQRGAYKNPEWVCRKDNDILIGPEGFSETVDFLNNKIQFQVSDNDIIPFYPIGFDEFSTNPVTELWIGPKSNIRPKDIELFLRHNGYKNTRAIYSRITYC